MVPGVYSGVQEEEDEVHAGVHELELDVHSGVGLGVYAGVQLVVGVYAGVQLVVGVYAGFQLVVGVYGGVQLVVGVYAGVQLVVGVQELVGATQTELDEEEVSSPPSPASVQVIGTFSQAA